MRRPILIVLMTVVTAGCYTQLREPQSYAPSARATPVYEYRQPTSFRLEPGDVVIVRGVDPYAISVSPLYADSWDRWRWYRRPTFGSYYRGAWRHTWVRAPYRDWYSRSYMHDRWHRPYWEDWPVTVKWWGTHAPRYRDAAYQNEAPTVVDKRKKIRRSGFSGEPDIVTMQSSGSSGRSGSSGSAVRPSSSGERQDRPEAVTPQSSSGSTGRKVSAAPADTSRSEPESRDDRRKSRRRRSGMK